MPQITVKELTVNYLDEGSGPVLLMLHGWGSSLRSYEQLIPLLSKHFRVIFPELPGFGESEEPHESWEVSDYVEFVKDFVSKFRIQNSSASADKINVYAHSFGARIAIKWLAGGDERVEKLIMCGAAGIKENLSTRQKSAQGLSKFKSLVPSFLAKPLRKVLYKFAGSSDYDKASPIMKETLQKVVDENLSPLLSKIKVPTLLVWGKHDTYTPLHQGELMHEQIKNSKLVVIETAKHGVHLQEPQKLAELVSDFIQNLESRI